MANEKYFLLSSGSLSALMNETQKYTNNGWSKLGEVIKAKDTAEYYQEMVKLDYKYMSVCRDTKEELIQAVSDLVEQGWESDGPIIVSENQFCKLLKRKSIGIFPDRDT